MRNIVGIFYFLGLLLGSIGLIYSFAMLVALNGIGAVFKMEEPEIFEFQIQKDSIAVNIHYTYIVESKEYTDFIRINAGYLDRFREDSIVIKYNAIFPGISLIDGIPIKQREQKIGVFISLFFLLFLLLLWNLSDREKWVKTYEEVGNRPWLFPSDKSIKNPLMRFKSRLFKG